MTNWYGSHSLTNEEINRFSRQLILQGFGVAAQEKLRNSRVLIVGAGGLGCPVAIYCAAAGIGTIGIVDYDTVSADNLHRQILHDESRIGKNKAQSIKESIKRLILTTNVILYETVLTADNALNILQNYHIIVDCTDNVPTRYLLNDSCVLSGKPLVSGSALGWEGQLTVYNNGPKCPCYRCIFPVPPNPSTISNCSDSGVLGPIVGIIGSLQALEVIRIAAFQDSPFSGYLWLFDGSDGRTKKICLREKLPHCAICGKNPTITKLQDYVAFCGLEPTDKTESILLLPEEERIAPQNYFLKFQSKGFQFLIDVRPQNEFQICHLPEAKNIPLDDIRKLEVETIFQILTSDVNLIPNIVYVVCHHGNDSQRAVCVLKEKALRSNYNTQFFDILGGLELWSIKVDRTFPRY